MQGYKFQHPVKQIQIMTMLIMKKLMNENNEKIRKKFNDIPKACI